MEKKSGIWAAFSAIVIVICILIGYGAVQTVTAQAGTKDGEPVLISSKDNSLKPTEGIDTPTESELEDVFTISADTLETYAWVNEDQCTMPVKEVAVDIQGLSTGGQYKTDPVLQDTTLGEKGVLVVQPYNGPWNWMSFETIDTIDKVLDAVWEKYNLSEDTPLVLFGRSMGGMGVLNYARYGEHEVSGVALNCPVTNLSYHVTERPDCASTIYRAYNYYEEGPAAGVEEHDPMNFIDELPDVPYFFVAGEADIKVNKSVHSDVYVPLMKEKGYDVQYLEVPGMEHVDLVNHPEALQMYADFITSFAK